MKRFLIVLSIAVTLLIMLASCSEGPYYDQGFDDGFSAGIEYCEEERYADYEDRYNDGYKEGYEEGHKNGYEWGRDSRTPYWLILDEAYGYARDRSEWSVYEAAENVSLFLDGDPGVTEEEYEQSVLTLLYFYDFLSSCKYLNE